MSASSLSPYSKSNLRSLSSVSASFLSRSVPASLASSQLFLSSFTIRVLACVLTSFGSLAHISINGISDLLQAVVFGLELCNALFPALKVFMQAGTRMLGFLFA